VDVLTDPGRADLSAYVDFGAMRRVIECRKDSGVECFGPVTQRDLLFGLGIGQWLEKMVEKCSTEEEVDRLIAGCERLVSGEEGALGEGGKTEGAGKGAGMGFRYKALAMVSKGLGKPAGF
jgi:NADH dehydrogenase [ubiquinone] 1 alpha subcomplex assembly factor 7